MGCKTIWTKKFISKGVSQTFFNKEYKEWRRQYLFGIEMSLMPASQVDAEEYLRLRDLTIESDEAKYQREIHDVEVNKVLRDIRTAQKFHMTKEKAELDMKLTELRNVSLSGHLGIYASHPHYPDAGQEKRKFVKKCPFPECPGYLSSQWKCGLCENWTCSECFEVTGKERGHGDETCNPDILATAQLIKTDTKQCPKCSEGIYRIYGCDAMFCTLCNTSFSWNSGRISTARAHNPHYIEWLQKNGIVEREPGDIPCGLEVEGYMIAQRRRILDGLYRSRSGHNLVGLLIPYYQQISHVTEYDIPRFTSYPDNSILRRLYLMKILTLEEFKKKIAIAETSRERAEAKATIANTYIISATDIYHREMEILKLLVANYKDKVAWEQLKSLYMEYETLVKQCDSVQSIRPKRDGSAGYRVLYEEPYVKGMTRIIN